MPFPQVTRVAPGSPAERAGLRVGDELRRVNGAVPSDVIEYRLLTDEPEVELELARGGLELRAEVAKAAGEPLGLEVSSAVFDRVRTCDNHCAFCFIYQLPKGMRRSLYVKDDDYRLSFLYGNFTTLTRFTELDLERVVCERLSPLYVSIHATDPALRARMLRNRRGATSLRWLRQLLAHGIEVHGQLVICPGVNDGPALEETLAGILEWYPELASAAAVPLGVSRYSNEAEMRPHTKAEAEAVLDCVERWQGHFATALGRRLVFAADEYYLLAGRPLPPPASYEGFPQVENGVGMAQSFAGAFCSGRPAHAETAGQRGGFFASVDGAPALGYRAERVRGAEGVPAGTSRPGPAPLGATHVPAGTSRPGPAPLGATHVPAGTSRPGPAPLGATHVSAGTSGPPGPAAAAPRSSPGAPPVTIVTGQYGAAVLRPLLDAAGYGDVEVLPVENGLFGGNIAVTGLLGGGDVARALAGRERAASRRYLLPDVCLSEGRFLDGLSTSALPVGVEVVETDGAALRRALDHRGRRRPLAVRGGAR